MKTIAKYTVLKHYNDLKLNKTLSPLDEVEYTDDRFKEVSEVLENFGGGFLKKVEQPKKRAKKVVDEE